MTAAAWTLRKTIALCCLAVTVATACRAAEGDRLTSLQEGMLERAKILIEDRNPAAALPILEKLLQENPDLPGIRYHAALAAQMTRDNGKALSLAVEAVTRGEDSAPLQVLIGMIAMQEKKLPEAHAAFQRAAELDPSDDIALYNLSEVLREQGRPKEALEALRRARKLEPKRELLALKSRLAEIECGENVEEIELEVITRKGEEDQSEDWLMTAAAIHLKNGNYRQAIDALRAARALMGLAEIRAIFTHDHFFRQFADDKEMAEFRQELGSE